MRFLISLFYLSLTIERAFASSYRCRKKHIFVAQQSSQGISVPKDQGILSSLYGGATTEGWVNSSTCNGCAIPEGVYRSGGGHPMTGGGPSSAISSSFSSSSKSVFGFWRIELRSGICRIRFRIGPIGAKLISIGPPVPCLRTPARRVRFLLEWWSFYDCEL